MRRSNFSIFVNNKFIVRKVKARDFKIDSREKIDWKEKKLLKLRIELRTLKYFLR